MGCARRAPKRSRGYQRGLIWVFLVSPGVADVVGEPSWPGGTLFYCDEDCRGPFLRFMGARTAPQRWNGKDAAPRPLGALCVLQRGIFCLYL